MRCFILVDALSCYQNSLTEYERKEIQEYKEIWCVGQDAKKIHAERGASLNGGYDDDSGSYLRVCIYRVTCGPQAKQHHHSFAYQTSGAVPYVLPGTNTVFAPIKSLLFGECLLEKNAFEMISDVEVLIPLAAFLCLCGTDILTNHLCNIQLKSNMRYLISLQRRHLLDQVKWVIIWHGQHTRTYAIKISHSILPFFISLDFKSIAIY